MFTGIIEALGIIEKIETQGTNKIYWISSPIAHELTVDQSVSHNGICLTIDAIENGLARLTAIHETLQKTTIGSWKIGDHVNLERCLMMNGRIDGHIVQGHVDCTAECITKSNKNGSWEYRFVIPEIFAALLIDKGSISINGISLTIFDLGYNEFSVAIIPYTYDHTNLSLINIGDSVNIEFDIIGKYINRLAWLNSQSQ